MSDARVIQYTNDKGAYVEWDCPRQEGRVCTVPTKDAREDGWDWDGNKEEPTLQPSVHCLGCDWHGHIFAGMLRPRKGL